LTHCLLAAAKFPLTFILSPEGEEIRRGALLNADWSGRSGQISFESSAVLRWEYFLLTKNYNYV